MIPYLLILGVFTTMTLSLIDYIEKLEYIKDAADKQAAIRGRNVSKILRLRQTIGANIRQAKKDKAECSKQGKSTKYVDHYIKSQREKLEVFEERYTHLVADYKNACRVASEKKLEHSLVNSLRG